MRSMVARQRDQASNHIVVGRTAGPGLGASCAVYARLEYKNLFTRDIAEIETITWTMHSGTQDSHESDHARVFAVPHSKSHAKSAVPEQLLALNALATVRSLLVECFIRVSMMPQVCVPPIRPVWSAFQHSLWSLRAS
jgi:hypothetical protein